MDVVGEKVKDLPPVLEEARVTLFRKPNLSGPSQKLL
jgi:hypothetical protein